MNAAIAKLRAERCSGYPDNWPIVPCLPFRSDTDPSTGRAKNGKVPLISGWQNLTTASDCDAAWESLAPIFAEYPNNVGICVLAGKRSLLWLDLDQHGNDGWAAMVQFIAAHSKVDAATADKILTESTNVHARTPSGGHHLGYQWTPELDSLQTTTSNPNGCDLRGNGNGQVVGVGTLTPKGIYSWNGGNAPDWSAVPPCPPWLLAFVQTQQNQSKGSKGNKGGKLGTAANDTVAQYDLCSLDLLGLLDDLGIGYYKSKSKVVDGKDVWADLYVLDQCPWHASHSGGSDGATINVPVGKRPSFSCVHAHCKDKGINDLLALVPESTLDSRCSKWGGAFAVASPTTTPASPVDGGKPLSPTSVPYQFGAVKNTLNRYLGGTLDYQRVNYVRSPRETGKTTAVAQLLIRQAQQHPEFRSLVVVHRVALGNSYLQKLESNGWKLYSECPKGPIYEDKVVVCLDSLPRINAYAPPKGQVIGIIRPVQWDCVFIDESEQLFRHIDSDTIRKHSTPEQIVDALRLALRNADHVILADADLGSLTVDCVRLLMGWDVKTGSGLVSGRPIEYLRINDGANAYIQRKAELYSGDNHGYAQIHQSIMSDWQAGKKLVIGTTTRIEAKLIADELQRARSGALVLCVTSETSGNLKAFLTNPDSWTYENEPDAVVYSPSMGTGFDLSVKDYWDECYMVAPVGTWTTYTDVMQALERCRAPRNQQRHVWVEEKELFGQTDPAVIAQQITWGVGADLAVAIQHVPQPDGSIIPVPHCPVTLDIVARVRSHRHLGQRNVRGGVLGEMGRCKWAVVPHVSVSTVELLDLECKRLKGLKKSIRATEIKAVVTAKPIPLDQAKAILDGDRGCVAPGDIASARKAMLIDLVGESIPVDTKLVREWVSGQLGKHIEMFVAVMAGLKQQDSRLTALSNRQIARWNKTSSGRICLAQSAVIVLVLGVPHKTDFSQSLIKTGLCGTIQRAGFRGITETTPVQKLLGVLLGAMGVKNKRVTKRDDRANYTHVYELDKASVARMRLLSARWADRLDGKWTVPQGGVISPFEDPTLDGLLDAALNG